MEITVLEDRIIKVEPIIRNRAFFSKGHDGEHTFTGCHKDYGLPLSSQSRTYLNPFKNDSEQSQFEYLLNQKEGNLNVYDRKSKFWGDFGLMLTKDGKDLNLNNPIDALLYRVFLVNPRFANSEAQETDLRCEFKLVDSEVKEKAKGMLALREEKAIDYFSSIKKSKIKLYNILRLLNKKPDINASIEFFKSEILSIIKEPVSKGVTNIEDFIRVIEDPSADLKIFILDAVDAGEIVLDSSGYRTKEFNKFLGKHLEQAVDFFSSKDAEVLEIKALISQRLKD